MKEERKMVLDMVKDGKVSAEEGDKLLADMEEPKSAKKTIKAGGTLNKKFLRIRVTDNTEGASLSYLFL